MPPSRRSLLRTAAVAGTPALAGCLGDSPLADPVPPDPDTRPLADYDPQHTVANRDADPPSDPRVETVDSIDDAETVVVGGDERRVLVGGKQVDRRGGFLQAFAFGGDVRWTVTFETAVRSVAPVGDRVYAATDGGRLGVVS
jgi:hypothetical protein